MNISISLPTPLIARIDAERGIGTRSAYIRRAIEMNLDQRTMADAEIRRHPPIIEPESQPSEEKSQPRARSENPYAFGVKRPAFPKKK